MYNIDLSAAAAIDAVVDAALAHQVSVFCLDVCRLSGAAAPALARLLGGGAVTELLLGGSFESEEQLWADEAGAALLCDALRANTSLRDLGMCYFEAWTIPAAGAALLAALTGHPSLRWLDMTCNIIDSAQQLAAALGALVAADTLTHLDLTDCGLGDVALGPLFDALRCNTQLRTLHCAAERIEIDHLTEAFVRDRVLPAVRANTGLRELWVAASDWDSASAREAEALVACRPWDGFRDEQDA
jgi:hypothetical protein